LTHAPLELPPGRAIPRLECTGDDEQALFREVQQRLAMQRAITQ
jgi:hypothetical protein